MKKTLATLLVVALVASLCGVMFVSAEVTNVALGKTWTGDTEIGTSYTGNLTDGQIEPAGKYDESLWYGADRRKAEDDDTFTMILDLEETYNNISEVAIHVWPAGHSGICVPGSIVFSISTDGETYTELGSVSTFGGSDPQWVKVALENAVSGRYVKIDMVGAQGSGVFWFASEIAVNTGVEVDDPTELHVATISHVNLYSWNAYNGQIITGEGNDSMNYPHVQSGSDFAAFDATGYVVIKVENVDGVYTVTAVEGAGVAKTLTAPADGFLLYCGTSDNDTFVAAAKIQVGDVLLETDVDWHTDVASATPVGTMTFGTAVETEEPETPVEPEIPANGETLKVDGKLNDSAYDNAVWFTDGIWQSATAPVIEDLEAAYTVRCDDENIYLTIKVNQGVDFKTALNPEKWDQSGATNFRIWALGDGMETRTFYDLLWDGENFIPHRQKVATDELTFATEIGDDFINLEIAIAKSTLNITDSFKLMVTYSTPYCGEGEDAKYNAFHMTACDEMPSNWSGTADAYNTYTCEDIKLIAPTTPETGDESVLVFAVLGLLAIVGAAVAIKVKG